MQLSLDFDSATGTETPVPVAAAGNGHAPTEVHETVPSSSPQRRVAPPPGTDSRP